LKIKLSIFLLILPLWLSCTLAVAQPSTQAVSDLVIQSAENQTDILLNWSRPPLAIGFQIHAGDSVNFAVSGATQIGNTADTTFIHVNGLADAARRYYAVVAIYSDLPNQMVLVPAGSYQMGAEYQEYAQPIHTVNVPAFYIDIYEVTNAQYRTFCDATGRAYPPDPGFSGMPNYFTDSAYSNYPVVMVSWNDAKAYATWAGKRLPTEAEWERAAKGDADNRNYPWGNAWVATNANTYNNPADGFTYTAPVGTFSAGISPAGCYDMSGNVWEWCEDDWHWSYEDAPADGSAWTDAPRGLFRVERGGSWLSDGTFPRCAFRYENPPTYRYYTIGFRCVISAQ
jgi:formylglycine-generating enzyme required for sulfatase activity